MDADMVDTDLRAVDTDTMGMDRVDTDTRASTAVDSSPVQLTWYVKEF